MFTLSSAYRSLENGCWKIERFAMTLFEKVSSEAELFLTSVVVNEETDDGAADPYVVEMKFDGELPGGASISLAYHTWTKQPGSRMNGEFVGTETILLQDGSQLKASPKGVWNRNGQRMSLVSLCNQSDGSLALRVIDVKLSDNQQRMARLTNYSL